LLAIPLWKARGTPPAERGWLLVKRASIGGPNRKDDAPGMPPGAALWDNSCLVKQLLAGHLYAYSYRYALGVRA
jgi:hypothetical protein